MRKEIGTVSWLGRSRHWLYSKGLHLQIKLVNDRKDSAESCILRETVSPPSNASPFDFFRSFGDDKESWHEYLMAYDYSMNEVVF